MSFVVVFTVLGCADDSSRVTEFHTDTQTERTQQVDTTPGALTTSAKTYLYNDTLNVDIRSLQGR